MAQDLTFCVCKYKDESEVEPDPIKVGGFRRGGMTKNGGRIWAHDRENSVVDPLGERSSQTVALGLTMSSSGADNRQIRVFLVLRYISPLATSRSAVRPWMVRWSSPSSIEPSNSGHRV